MDFVGAAFASAAFAGALSGVFAAVTGADAAGVATGVGFAACACAAMGINIALSAKIFFTITFINLAPLICSAAD